MYLETYSMEELMELIEEKGYCSVEAVEILKEMEQAKKEYDFLLRDCEGKAWKTDQIIVDYYRHVLEELSYEVLHELSEVINFSDPEHLEIVWKYRDEFLEAVG